MEKTELIVAAAALAALLIANAIAFALMGRDKRLARTGGWRVPERTLFLAAACFGALGGVLGMRVFRQVLLHRGFELRVFFPALLIVQIMLLGLGAYLLFR